MGSLNPQIFQPEWFARNELIRPVEAGAATIEAVTPEITIFHAEWFDLQVTRDKFQITALEARFDQLLRDLVLGTFTLLRHTPITAVGLNRALQFHWDGAAAWHAFGDALAPKDMWLKVMDGEPKPGLLALTVQGSPKGRPQARLQIRVQPIAEYGVLISTNEHFPTAAAQDATTAMDVVSKYWTDAQTYSQESARALIEACPNA